MVHVFVDELGDPKGYLAHHRVVVHGSNKGIDTSGGHRGTRQGPASGGHRRCMEAARAAGCW